MGAHAGTVLAQLAAGSLPAPRSVGAGQKLRPQRAPWGTCDPVHSLTA